jgi:hypothetical protein
MEKVKKTLSTEQLEKLKVAREKALSVRQTNAKNKALERELVVAEKEQHLNIVKEKLAKVKAPKGNAEPIIVVEEEPESEPEVVIKKKVKIKKKKIIVVEDSDTDEEQQQVIYVKKVKNKESIPVPIPVPLIEQPTLPKNLYQKEYNSIFNQRPHF